MAAKETAPTRVVTGNRFAASGSARHCNRDCVYVIGSEEFRGGSQTA
jgi:hypothetical protein